MRARCGQVADDVCVLFVVNKFNFKSPIARMIIQMSGLDVQMGAVKVPPSVLLETVHAIGMAAFDQQPTAKEPAVKVPVAKEPAAKKPVAKGSTTKMKPTAQPESLLQPWR